MFFIYLLVAAYCHLMLFKLTKFYNTGGKWVSSQWHFHALAIYAFIPVLQWFTLAALWYYILAEILENHAIVFYSFINTDWSKL